MLLVILRLKCGVKYLINRAREDKALKEIPTGSINTPAIEGLHQVIRSNLKYEWIKHPQRLAHELIRRGLRLFKKASKKWPCNPPISTKQTIKKE